MGRTITLTTKRARSFPLIWFYPRWLNTINRVKGTFVPSWQRRIDGKVGSQSKACTISRGAVDLKSAAYKARC
jgi:hypothetical protein